jgi:hypothetical protein
VGSIEGIAESTASILKIFSGALSDYWGKRKSLAIAWVKEFVLLPAML